MTVVEMVIVIGVFSLVMLGTTVIFAALWRAQTVTIHGGRDALSASHAITRVADMLRGARRADNGAYVLVRCEASELIFFADADGDNDTERIRVFRDGDMIFMGIIQPSSSIPTTYDGEETVRVIARSVMDNPENIPLFSYYDAENNLLNEAMVSAVRMVRIMVTVGDNTPRAQSPTTITTMISLRNLRSW